MTSQELTTTYIFLIWLTKHLYALTGDVETHDVLDEAIPLPDNKPIIPIPEPTEEPEVEVLPMEPTTPKSNASNIMIIVIAVVAGIAGYYFKILLPKKRLEEAEDFEDYEFIDEDINDDE